jgi:hypothetical protein
MRLMSALVFDDVISGPGVAGYTPAQFNSMIGAADGWAVQAYTTMVAGGTANLTVSLEHSADNQNWFSSPTPVIGGLIISNDNSVWGWTDSLLPVLMGYVRFRIAFGGTQCRLKLYVTGRVRPARGFMGTPMGPMPSGTGA